MKLRLIVVGRTERGYIHDGEQEYLDRLRRNLGIEEIVLTEAGKGEPEYQRRVESKRILGSLKPGERVVVMDERGKELTSIQFAERLGSWQVQRVKQVAFVIGGANGMTDEVRESADLVLALSRMTFPHQLVRILFAEQLYRAYSILQGTPYHR